MNRGSTRDASLMSDPNSLFAVSRALRKRIVETDPNPQNRNEAIRDEKHLAYKVHGKDNYETFKYDIITNLELLDTYILELETVLGKITRDKNRIILENKVVRLRGGVLPDLPSDATVMDNLKAAMTADDSSRFLKKLLRMFVPPVENLLAKYRMGELTIDDVMDGMNTAYERLPQNDVAQLDTVGEQDGMLEIFNAIYRWLDTLPTYAPEALAEPVNILKQRGTIPLLSGNEFLVSTLSKINFLLIKLIAEYNGKILVNYKNFLQSDLEEIALKIIDSQRRYLELKSDLEDFKLGAKVVDISKFLSTIEMNFQKLFALSSRSIANYQNPSLTSIPSFSQQLSIQDKPNDYKKYNDAFLKERDSVFNPARQKILKYNATLQKYQDKQTLNALSNREINNYRIIQKNR